MTPSINYERRQKRQRGPGELHIPFALFVSPLVGVVGGFLTGLIGYPFYAWLSRGVGFESEGALYVHFEETLRGVQP